MQINKSGICGPGVWLVRFEYNRESLGAGLSTVCTNWSLPVWTEEKAWALAKRTLKIIPGCTDVAVFNERYEQSESGGAAAQMRTLSKRYPVLRRTWNGGQPVPGPGWPLSTRARAAIRLAWNIVRKKCAQ
jgi:hypothetical protein